MSGGDEHTVSSDDDETSSSSDDELVVPPKKFKSSPPPGPIITADMISAVIGSGSDPDAWPSPNPRLLMPQLVQIIASYLAPFVTTRRQFEYKQPQTGYQPVCAIDSHSVIACRVGIASDHTLYKLSLLTGW